MLRGIVLGAAASLCCLDMAFASPRMDFIYRPSKNEIRYESRAFLPIHSTKDSLLFGDIRGVSNFDTATEFNLGLGMRHYFPSQDVVLGGYYFYDRRYQGEVYTQNTFGGEILGKFFEARANFYRPLDASNSSIGGTTLTFDSFHPILTSGVKTAANGKEIEGGVKLPLNDKELWFYGSYYKFEAGDGTIYEGKKGRIELDFANSLPAGITSSFGVEYDYNDKKDERATTITFRVGLPFASKGTKYRDDYRMTKPIVRDVDIKIIDNDTVVTEPATLMLTTGSEEAVFSEVAEVATEDELHHAIENERVADVPRAIVLNDHIITIRSLKITADDLVTSSHVKQTYVGDDTGTIFVKEAKTDASPPTLSHMGTDSGDDIGDNIHDVEHGAAKVFYDEVEYDSVEFVSTNDKMNAALVKTGNNIIIVTNDIISTGTRAYTRGENLAIMSSASIEIQDINGENSEIRNYTYDADIDVFSLNPNSPSNFNVIFDGVRLVKSYISSSNNMTRLVVKNSTYTTGSPHTTSLAAGHITLENVVVNLPSTNSNGLRIVNTYKGSGEATTKNVTIKDWHTTHGVYIGAHKTHNIEGTLIIEKKSGSTFRWSVNNRTNDSSTRYNFAQGSRIIIKNIDTGEVFQEFHVNNDVTIGQNGVLSPFYNQLVQEFDFSTLSPNIEKVQ